MIFSTASVWKDLHIFFYFVWLPLIIKSKYKIKSKILLQCGKAHIMQQEILPNTHINSKEGVLERKQPAARTHLLLGT